VQEKFIDLGVENLSQTDNDIIARQERLKKELDKLHFEFKTQCLDLPQGQKVQLYLDKDTISSIESTEASMGKDLD
jgi:hypothetical protein